MNPWIEHVKRYAKENGLAYACALSTPACKESYKSKAMPKHKDLQLKELQHKAHVSLLDMAKQAKHKSNQHKAHVSLLDMAKQAKLKPKPEVIIKPRRRVNPEIPIYFVTSNLKKNAYNKAVKQAEKLSIQAMDYINSFPEKSRRHYKQVIYGVINDIDEIRRIEEELQEPELSPSMIASRQNRLRETERALKDKLEMLVARGFKPSFL